MPAVRLPETASTSLLRFNLPAKGIQDRYTLRVDHQLTSKHTVEFVFNQAEFDSNPDCQLHGPNPNRLAAVRDPDAGLTWSFNSIFGQNETNEARVGYQRAPVGFNVLNDFADTGGFQLQFGGTLPIGGMLTDPTSLRQLPQGRNTPSGRCQTILPR